MTTIEPITSHKYAPERTASPPISPNPQSIYSHITIQYVNLIKQLITQMVFVKFNQRVIAQTNQTLEFMTCRSSNQDQDRQTDFDNIYQTILTEHISNHLPEIWDEIFAEHNIDIVLRYLVDLVNHLSVYSENTTTTDPKYTYSQQTIRKHFCNNHAGKNHYSRVIYLPETYIEFTKNTSCTECFTIRLRHSSQSTSYAAYQLVEHEKQIRNSILADVFGYIYVKTAKNPYCFGSGVRGVCEDEVPLNDTLEMPVSFDPNTFYVYLEQYARRLKQHDGTCIFDKNGNLEITESLLHRYAQSPTTTTYFEIYTIWLLEMWLK